jgi:hypothetical protein
LERPTERAMIEDWLELLRASVANPPDDDGFARRLNAVAMVCGELPAPVWGKETIRAAVKAFKFWPSVAEVFELLDAHRKRLLAELRALDRIANAVHGPVGARESTVPYPLPPPPQPRKAGPREPCDDDLITIEPKVDPATREEARARLAEIAAKRAGQPIVCPANDTGPRPIGELVRAVGKPGDAS